jgi:phosphatidylinositol alpha-1,6-mannosyltransferase
MIHLLVTNDFPPKVGGIQNYLWELWRRLPPDDFVVLTPPYPGSEEFDAEQAYRVVRTRQRFLLPTPRLRRQIDALADEIGADLVVFDPAVPVGAAGPSLRHRYAVILHGAEVTVPGRVPIARSVLARTVGRAEFVIAAGRYAGVEAERAVGRRVPALHVPPGVDTKRFRPLNTADRIAARRRLGLSPDATLVLGLSRLVPRKGFDTLIRGADRVAGTHPSVEVVIGGVGRDRPRLERLAAEVAVPTHFLGRLDDDDLPALYGTADVFGMLCRRRWGGLEQEGFGIVFLEAAAAGVPQLAGESGGAAEAVEDQVTGIVLDPPDDVGAAADALGRLVADAGLRRRMGLAARRRAVEDFSYGLLVERLRVGLAHGVAGELGL